MGQPAQANAADAELAVVRTWASTKVAAVIATSLELGLALTLLN